MQDKFFISQTIKFRQPFLAHLSKLNQTLSPMSENNYYIDFNKGLDARLITYKIAGLLVKIK